MGRVRPVDAVRQAGCRCGRAAEVVTRGPWWVCATCEVGVRASGVSREVEQGGEGIGCHYCGRTPEEHRVELTWDHIVPVSLLGGRGTRRGQGVRNRVWACASCNRAKGAERSACRCAKCRWAWRKWGPAGWETWDVWAPKKMYKSA